MKHKHKLLTLLFLIGGIFLFSIWFLKKLEAPEEFNQQITLKLDKNRGFKSLVKELENKKIVQNSWASWIYARTFKNFHFVPAGIYKIEPHSSTQKIIQQLMSSQHHWVCIPEGFWINRTAKFLEEKKICSAQKYIELAHQPHLFQNKVSFPLPKDSLEGYLYPDTYDFKHDTDPFHIITSQLKEFEKQVVKSLKPSNEALFRAITMASILQLEASDPKERKIISGILEARIKKDMRLQLCSTVLYALQSWRPLNIGEAKKVDSPYNTYRNKGLPPGPICSPCIDSIKAAVNPTLTPYLFFVSAPQDKHFFAVTFKEHVNNIRLSRSLLKTK